MKEGRVCTHHREGAYGVCAEEHHLTCRQSKQRPCHSLKLNSACHLSALICRESHWCPLKFHNKDGGPVQGRVTNCPALLSGPSLMQDNTGATDTRCCSTLLPM